MGWLADYPDPDNFLHHSSIISTLRIQGWQDEAYDRLVEEAARANDRAKRMALYRQADHWLVSEQALVLPIAYGSNQQIRVAKTWVSNFKPSLLDHLNYQDIVLEEH